MCVCVCVCACVCVCVKFLQTFKDSGSGGYGVDDQYYKGDFGGNET